MGCLKMDPEMTCEKFIKTKFDYFTRKTFKVETIKKMFETHPAFTKEDCEYEFKNDSKSKGFYQSLYSILLRHSENYSNFSSIDENLLFEIWHEAYEWNLIKKTVSVLSSKNSKTNQKVKSKKIQVITCIDDREESLRRYFEEVDPQCETFGYAGHFGLNICLRLAKERAL